MRIRRCVPIVLAVLLSGPASISASPPWNESPAALQGTAFTYQGELRQAGLPVSSNTDMTFALFDAAVGGNQVGSTLSFTAAGGNAVPVLNGIFTVALDFGPLAFNGPASSERYLRATVNGVTLSPRTKIQSAPYALQARASEGTYALITPMAMTAAGGGSTLFSLTSSDDSGAASFKVDHTFGVSAAVKGEVNSIFANFGTAGIYGVSSGTGGYAGLFYASNASGNGPALVAIANGNGNGITANASNGGNGIETTADGNGYSLYAWKANFATGTAVRIRNFNASNTSPLLHVTNTGTAAAARFEGNVQVTGTLSKGAGSFQIDHPLAPADKYLYHSFVESPDMKNVYDGIATLDRRGEAWVELPDWFKALNETFRYQLTALGTPAPNLHVADEIVGNRFRVAGGGAGQRISWQVTGIRHDAFARAHRIPVEVDKPAQERGTYLYPELHAADAPATPDAPALRDGAGE